MSENREHANHSIECGATDCCHHCRSDCYCALEKIRVGEEKTGCTCTTDCRCYEKA
jgi:hypothetical protein